MTEFFLIICPLYVKPFLEKSCPFYKSANVPPNENEPATWQETMTPPVGDLTLDKLCISPRALVTIVELTHIAYNGDWRFHAY